MDQWHNYHNNKSAFLETQVGTGSPIQAGEAAPGHGTSCMTLPRGQCGPVLSWLLETTEASHS